jgi:formamidopyrimidine-DNA glycosylase
MPELPEVETVCRGLAPYLVGARIENVVLSSYRLRFEYPQGFVQSLIGRTINVVKRRAKYIIAELDSDQCAIVHLGMSGRITLVGEEQALSFDAYLYQTGEKAKHDHVKLELSKDGRNFQLVYNDPRRFGLWDIAQKSDIEGSKHFSHLGPEPLEDNFDGAALLARIGKKAAPIKLALLNQEIVVGLGNIYVCEALFMSHIHPERPANSLKLAEADLLVKNIKIVLRKAIESGGSTLRDFQHADGSLGGFQNNFLAYDCEGKTCTTPNCGGTIERIVQGGRSTFFCRKCQK